MAKYRIGIGNVEGAGNGNMVRMSQCREVEVHVTGLYQRRMKTGNVCECGDDKDDESKC